MNCVLNIVEVKIPINSSEAVEGDIRNGELLKAGYIRLHNFKQQSIIVNLDIPVS